jgi:hypothetical protein
VSPEEDATLVRLNPAMRMCFISGAGTKTQGRAMWARVKGETEDALAAMPWKSAHMFRPGLIQPLRGIAPRAVSFRILLVLLWPVFLVKKLMPGLITTTVVLGRAMIRVARDGHEQGTLDSAAINVVGS